MKVTIQNKYLEDLYVGKELSGKPKYQSVIVKKFIKTVQRLMFSDSIADIKAQKSLHFEALKREFKGKYSVRVDIKYRLILRIEKDRMVVEDVIVIEDLTNHYR